MCDDELVLLAREWTKIWIRRVITGLRPRLMAGDGGISEWTVSVIVAWLH
jgi:hypothetical protein